MQFVLGAADVLLLAPVWLQLVHLLGADLYWVALVVGAAMVVWPAIGHLPWMRSTERSFVIETSDARPERERTSLPFGR